MQWCYTMFIRLPASCMCLLQFDCCFCGVTINECNTFSECFCVNYQYNCTICTLIFLNYNSEAIGKDISFFGKVWKGSVKTARCRNIVHPYMCHLHMAIMLLDSVHVMPSIHFY